MDDFDARLAIYSKPSVIVDRLIQKFKDKYLDVITFDSFTNIDLSKVSYLIVNLVDDPNLSIVNISQDLKKMIAGLECKITIVLPMYVLPEEKYIYETSIADLFEVNKNIGIILSPEILGNAVKFNSTSLSHDLIMQSLTSERIKIKDLSLLINTISTAKLVDKIVKETFSFGISGQVLALIGQRKGIKTFLTKYVGVNNENIILAKGNNSLVEINHNLTSSVDFSLRLAVKATLNTFLGSVKKEDFEIFRPKSQILEPIKDNIKKTNRATSKDKFVSRLFTILIGLFVVLVAPMVTLLIAILLFSLSVKFTFSNSSLSEKLISSSLKTVAISQKINLGIPFYFNYSNITYKTVFIFNEVFELSRIGNEFAVKIMGNEAYDLSIYSDSISAILDRIHSDIGFLESDVIDLNDFLGKEINRYLLNKKINIDEYKNKIYLLRNFTSRLSVLLGVDRPMKYLVLFQNNMELRPTGGFIGSFALITFDKGRLASIDVNDVYSADGQLKGHVDPPEPIRQHLGEGGWYMRDANWDPSFPDAAEKIEWFLDKEINSKVDGVIAIDLSFVQKLLNVTGPITLNDFGKTITAENLYLNTQSEVESNFFPGSIKKASFMTSLSRELITTLETLPKDKYLNLLKEIYQSLESRHLQLFFHDLNAQDSILNLGYGGDINMNTDCGQRCFSDKYALVDANLGVNKANYFIKRYQDLKVTPSKVDIGHELLITYQNTANQAVGNSGVYKNYARLLIPLNSKIVGLRLYDQNNNYEDLKYDKTDLVDKQEIGFLITVLPGDSKRIQIVWNIDTKSLENGGEYRLLARKQAGTDADPFSLNIEKTDLSLTGRVPAVYTTTLGKDFSIKLFFKP